MSKNGIRLDLASSPCYVSKEDEIKVLNKLVEFFQARPNTYLSDLFTEEFADQLAWRIKNDMPCNVIESPIGSIFGH